MINEMTTLTTVDWRDTADYKKAIEHLQRAEWSEAAGALQYLLRTYPDEPELQSMLSETQLRLETEQAQTVSRRRLVLPNRRVLYFGALLLILVGLSFLAVRLYNTVIRTSIQDKQAAADQLSIFTQGQQALAAGDYDRALATFDQLAALNPTYPKLAENRDQANLAKSLAEDYDLAMAQMAAGSYSDAQATLAGIQRQSPNYRDVNLKLSQIERQQRLTGLMRQAGDAVTAQNWTEVVARLEEARPLTSVNDRTSLDADLFDAYMNLGTQTVQQSQGRPVDMARAEDLFGRALTLHPQQPDAEAQRGYAASYLAGYDAVKNSNWEGAIRELEQLYTAKPDYLDGEAARLLYNAYMRSGDERFSAQEPMQAWDRYYRASQLKGVDTSTAKALAANLSVHVTPTPAPLPTATPTPLPLALRATAVAEPAAVPLIQYKGKIAYYSNRGGQSAIWVMDPDGQNPVQLKDQSLAQKQYQQLRAAEAKSPDGRRSVFVMTPDNETNPQIFVAGSDGAATRVTSLNGMNADPVWSPTGLLLAFVSNQPGNDEVFVVGADGQGLKRLTNNTYEWDKHPSWSADGHQLVFWSNRSGGRPQIYVMGEDGANQVNISNNSYEERDPLWIK